MRRIICKRVPLWAIFFTFTLLQQVAVAATGPTITSVSPPPGTISELREITVTFSEPVSGVLYNDLLLNGAPASQVSGTNAVWTFSMAQPPYGVVQITWDPDHLIFDLDTPPNRFDANASGATWQYNLVDTTAPTVTTVTPAAGVTVRQLSQVEVLFSELVTGLEAADLLVNGTPAISLEVRGGGRYRFTFPQPSAGTVQLAWAPDHGIKDFAATPNSFAGGAWSYVLDPEFGLPQVRINEFLAANVTGLKDENLEAQDWIEIHNYGTNPVNLAGWSLTDDQDDPGRWVFPATNLAPKAFLVVFASAKDRRVAGGRLHTNFKLNSNGDYLGLYNAEFPRTIVSEFAPEFPEQRNDYSYGLDQASGYRYFRVPTPGAANGSSTILGVTPPPHFTVERGLYQQPFQLQLTTTVPGATIRYTTDGSEPSSSNGLVYATPFQISSTTVLRANATGPDLLPSVTVTHTYIFVDDVLKQSNNPPPGYPVGPTAFTGYPSDYEMDPEIVTNAAYGPMMRSALQALPTVSIAIKVDDMFGPVNGIYTHPEPPDSQRYLWERPCSVELMLTNGATAFQINCGIRMQGNASRTPQKTPKHPFRLMFRGDYGAGRLEYPIYPESPVTSFDTLVLRADFNNSWVHWDTGQRSRGTKMRDAWVKDTFREMGQASGHTRHFHLYINGLYWGVYDFGERIDAEFGASYYGGTAAEYDAIVSKPTEAIDGDMTAYNAMVTAVRSRDMRQLTNYSIARQHLDIPNYIDYILLNFFGGNQDWGFDGNWNAVRRRAPGETFKYITWDGEQLIVNASDNRVNNTDVPSGFHTNLINSLEYRLAFADRVHKHMFNNGALTTNANSQRWRKWMNMLDVGIVAESARWGDYRRDVHSYSSGPYYLYTRNEFWLPEVNRMLTSYFPQRNDIFLQQLRTAGLYPNVSAPVFSQHGGRAARGFALTMSAANPIYFTTNGVDPRVYGTGAIAPEARLYSQALVLDSSMVVKARALSGTNWSALNEAQFTVDMLGVPLRITEIMYNPPGGDAYEFIELQNIGTTAIDIGNYSLSGVTYTFPPLSVLNPGAAIVLASINSPGNWSNRYPGVTVFGWFDGNLSNGGEKLAVLNASRAVITSVDYDDENGWPTAADGSGSSLEIIDPWGNPDDPANWRASETQYGTPGVITPPPAPGSIVLNEIMAENLSAVANNGTYPDWVELHNRGTQPVDLGGWSLTDDGTVRKFVFPANTTIAPGGFLVVWCDSTTNLTPGLHTGFALGRNGDSLFLFDAQASRVDAISFGPQVANYSVGRIGQAWQLNQPTPNAANQPAVLAAATHLTINEWLANALPGGDDWIELYNASTSAPVSLYGLYLGTSNIISEIRSLSFVSPGGFVQLFADERPGADHLDFRLASAGGNIVLYSQAGEELNRVTYGPQAEGVSEGRLPDGSATIRAFPESASPRASNYLVTYAGPVLNEIMAVNSAAVTNAFGNTADWVELHNPNAAPFDFSGMRLGTGPAQSDQWIVPAGVSIPAQGYLVVWFDAAQPPSTAAGPALNTGRSLSGESGKVILFNRQGQSVNEVAYGFQVADFTIGRSGANGAWRLLATPTPGLANSAPATLGSPLALRINEWMAEPLDGNDWFELYHPGAQPVQLDGLFVSDSLSIPGMAQFAFSPLSFIGPKGFVKVVADADVSDGADHVNFNLDGNGEALRLSTAAQEIIDTIYFGRQQAGVSQGRLPDGTERLVDFPNSASPGDSNYLPIPGVVINEVLTHTDSPLEDAIELYNPTGQSIDIGGWFLSHSSRDYLQFKIPAGTILPAGGYRVFYEQQFNSGAPGSFTLNSARGDQVYLSAADSAGYLTGERAIARFGAAANGSSWGRHHTSAGVDFVPLSSRTFGVDSPGTLAEFRLGQGAFNAYPAVGPVVINEIMYHPVSTPTNDNVLDEYLEFHNPTAAPAPLFDPAHPANTWRLAGGVEYQFTGQITLPAGGYLLVVNFNPATNAAQLSAFRATFNVPLDVPVVGPYSGKLDNGGETIELLRPDNPQGPQHPDAGYVPWLQVEQITYSDNVPWPVSADGDGNSLQRRNAAQYGNEPLHWFAAAPTAGRPNVAQPALAPLILVQPESRNVVPNGQTTFSVAAAGTAPLAYQWHRNGAPVPGATSPVLVITQALNAGTYSVVVSNPAGSVTSSNAMLSLTSLPVISAHPQNVTTNSGTTVTLTVGVTGEGPMAFRWRRNGMVLADATNQTLVLSNIRLEEGGYYSALVSNPAGQVASQPALVDIFRSVEILTQPQSFTNNPGVTVTFSVAASGDGPLRYQWRWDGVDLAGETNTSLTVTNAQLENNGRYTVVVSDNRGAVESQPAFLSIKVRPTVVQHPDGATVAVGDTVSFTIRTRGTLPMEYRWRKISTYIATNIVNDVVDTITLVNVQTNDAAFYNVALANSAGLATQLSSNAYLTVVVPPTNLTVSPGESAVFQAQAYGRALMRYQWQFQGADLPGQTNAVLALENVQPAQAGRYTIVVSAITNRVIAPASFSADLVVGGSQTTLREPRWLSNGAFQLRLEGAPNMPYWIEIATNLVPWVPHATVRYTNGAEPFIDRDAGSAPQRFYRARPAP